MLFLKQNIKYLRNINGLTQPQLGEILGVSRDNVASYERGTVPPIDIFHKFVNYFNVSFNDLIEKDLSKEQINEVSDLARGDFHKSESTPQTHSEEQEAKQQIKSIEALEKIIEAQQNTIKSQQETIEALKMLLDRK
ncbi:MAG: helix-turn-helix domain-containing protein [Algoriphagus sp.]|jgi:transcriptional regulator with XRE-family HTH domain|nr:helix-turn-helix domain-containing protein [Algoriphagus sp.]